MPCAGYRVGTLRVALGVRRGFAGRRIMRVLIVMVPLAAVVVWGCSVASRDRFAHFFFEIPAASDGMRL